MSKLDAAITRTRVNIDNGRGVSYRGAQAESQPGAFIASNGNDAYTYALAIWLIHLDDRPRWGRRLPDSRLLVASAILEM